MTMGSITKEMLEERLELYQKELQQLPLMIKVYEGAIQDCNYWLDALKKEENGEANTN